MKTFQDFIADCLEHVDEVFPWDLEEMLASPNPPMLVDIREPYEFDALRIKGAINVPRGILEPACEYNYEETVPELVNGRDREIIIICRSGNRSLLAAFTMHMMGYHATRSLKTGIRGWNDYELPLYNRRGKLVDTDTADEILAPQLRPDQVQPRSRPAPIMDRNASMGYMAHAG